MPNNQDIVLVTDPETGELIRKDTGEVVSDSVLSQDKEWRSFEGEEGRIRSGPPMSLATHDMGLATVIGREGTDAAGKQIDSATLATMERLRMWQSRSSNRSPRARSLQRAFTQLAKIKGKLGLPDFVTEKAAYVYRKAQEKGLIQGDSIDSVLAASIYVATRQSGVLWTLDEISATVDVKPKHAGRSYRNIVSELDIKVPLVDHNRYIIRVANKLGLGERTKRKALELLDQARKKEILAGKDPTSIAASMIYLVALAEGLHKTQADIARAAGITEVTVRNRSKELAIKLELATR